MTISERIRKLRIENGISQTELSEKINSTKQNLYKYESGIITNIPSDKIEKIAEVFNVSPAYLMGWEEENFSDLVNKFKKLNADGQNKVNEYISDLLENPKYTAE